LKYNNKKQFGLILMVFGLVVAITPSSVGMVWGQTTAPLVSTRDHFNRMSMTGALLSGHNSIDYDPSDNIPGLDRPCEGEVAIYVHGVWTSGDFFPSFSFSLELPFSLEGAIEIFDRARMSLVDVNYPITLIGFSWDSDTQILPPGWGIAEIIAKKNGPKLAHFISDLKDNCPNTDIRLIAHSLGARVVLSSLDSLNKNQEWNNKNFKVTSVHLMGAAVDDEEVSKNSIDSLNQPKSTHDPFGVKFAYGKAVEDEVVNFYNLFNSQDDVLQRSTVLEPISSQPEYYPFFEEDSALGQKGIQLGISKPANYIDIPVKNEIELIDDANGYNGCDLRRPDLICTISFIGDNHLGYGGFRSSPFFIFFIPFPGTLIDNGAMDIVVKNWKNPPP
jgi:Alpha/beta hydrolase of unknown function (DUF900)